MLYCRQAKNDMSIQWVYEINLPGVVTGMLPSYRTMKYKSPIWGYFHVQKE